jgi:hypothetical protein
MTIYSDPSEVKVLSRLYSGTEGSVWYIEWLRKLRAAFAVLRRKFQ